MAIAPSDERQAPEDSLSTPKTTRLQNTSHLKMVPETKSLREQIRARAVQVADRLEKSQPLGKDEMEQLARCILAEMILPEGYLGWTMVALVSAFWHDQVAAVPPSRRLCLLPQCSNHAEGCPANDDTFGPKSTSCGACEIAAFRRTAEAMGYRVLVAEGSPIVLKILVSGDVDAIVGVASLNVLEKAIDKMLRAGIPCLAVPLLSNDTRNPSVDEDWVADMIGMRHAAPRRHTRTYLHLMRAAVGMFKSDQLEHLAPRTRVQDRVGELTAKGFDPLAGTEAIAYDFLSKGGKHLRPFITLAVYDALTGGNGTLGSGANYVAIMPDAVKRTALSIETFHKASLVHDDIEDDDGFRYGKQTVHRRWGIPTAINIGDYLIGLGYRLVSREAAQLGPGVTADILDQLADAHMKLCEGQGAELLWRDACDKRIKAVDALKIYALKTAPAFEAALVAGVRLAGPAEKYLEPMTQFARHLGVAFQILNDLNDWQQDSHNKLAAGGDALGGRPTVLWALAIESLAEDQRQTLEGLVASEPNETTLKRVRSLYETSGVFEKASRLVEKYRERAEAVADEIEPDELRRLLYYLIDTVLDRPAADSPSTGVDGEPSDPAGHEPTLKIPA